MSQTLITALIVAIMGFFQAALAIGPEDVPRITKEQLRAQLGNPDIFIVDVRSTHDWDNSKSRIKGAVREDPSRLGAWIDKYPKEKTIVFYCK